MASTRSKTKWCSLSTSNILTKKICSKGLKLCSWKVWLNSETDTLFTIFEQICNLLKYVISRPFELKGHTSLCLSQCLWLKVSLGIRWYCFTESNAGIFIYIARPVPNRRYETRKIVFHNRSSFYINRACRFLVLFKTWAAVVLSDIQIRGEAE
jgi:hypothetical protein